ncbi:MAG: DnaJ domain-containing protein [Phycisphaerales bacterium]|nr:DnaJ domain-containing protein [Phycisphaerales bacterium]
MAKRDYYDILSVGRQATAGEIKQRYRQLARKLHPDVNKSPDAAEKFAEVQAAYDVLSDAQKRRQYDRFGHAGAQSPFGGAGPGGGMHTWSNIGGDQAGFDMSDVGSIFEEMFAGRRPGGMRGRAAAGHGRGRAGAHGGGRGGGGGRGEDLHHELKITFYTAVVGGKESIHLTRPEAGGSRTQTLDVTIPPGISDGAKLRLRGKGHPGPRSAGDLILTIRVGSHPYFRRDGLDLLLDVPISIVEAALGTTVELPLYPEGTIELRIPPSSSSGRKLRVKGKGICGNKGACGDLYAVLKIVGPTDLSDADEALLRGLGERLPEIRTGRPWEER